MVFSVLGAGYTPGLPDSDPKIQALSPPLDAQIRAKAKEVLVEDELAKRR
jgi:DnaJ family protein C protein 8